MEFHRSARTPTTQRCHGVRPFEVAWFPDITLSRFGCSKAFDVTVQVTVNLTLPDVSLFRGEGLLFRQEDTELSRNKSGVAAMAGLPWMPAEVQTPPEILTIGGPQISSIDTLQ